ncbi:PAS domain S-box-containing protein/diguanylate cyclase (GGDEF)-like protein [Alkalispirillum mobile]|uniref:PAS domain S-box-containing protein/diguanylate cyclase (GGDEF)-like protein n=1 Tax=Alkalispirillum mobile TaxID=85925 RepID=A0A498C7I5_9GAMM|nr:EAL domain-containing protein [Alkalispirillum mobile]RLK51039.1 PAS domain S-box-containing protein/diguanylate cyclase (GGDEF)-like protein [Alkalispirillum mobile]
MKQNPLVRLLITEESPNDAEIYVSVLRNSGYAVRARRIESIDNLRDTLQEKPADMMLCSLVLREVPVDTAYQLIQQWGKDIPIIASSHEQSQDQRRYAMQMGAQDLVSKNDLEHLKLVVERELRHLHERRRLRRLESSVRETERRCRALLDSSRDPIAYVHEGMHIYANPAYLEMFGHQELADIEGMPILDMVVDDDQGACKEALRRFSRGDLTSHEVNLGFVTTEGPEEVTMVLTPATVDDEPCTQVLLQLSEPEADLELLNRQDVTTGLYNRSYFLEQLDNLIARNLDSDGRNSHALLYIQLEKLSHIRDRIGLAAVDQVVAHVAKRITNLVGEHDIPCRLADEEFTILLQHSKIDHAMEVAEKLRQDIEEQLIEVDDRTLAITCAIGAAMVGTNADNAQAAVDMAYAASETALRAGGNQVQLHASGQEIMETQQREAHWRERIHQCLQNDEFYLVYQPVIALAENADWDELYEVRIRMEEDGKEVEPLAFLPYAEQAGLMRDIDRWVARRTVALAGERKRMGKRSRLFVKLDGATLGDTGFLDLLREEIEQHQVDPASLVFQVNEPVVVTQLNQAKALQEGLEALGCKLSLDHFGSALNPFQLLKHLRSDQVKLDDSLTADIEQTEENQKLVKQIIDTAHEMGQQVVAGYLGHPGALALMWEYGADYVQGDFLQEPGREMNYDFSEMVF